MRLEKLDSVANEKLNMYVGDSFKPDDFGKPDSALLVIKEIIRKEPKLKYAPLIASHTFSSLLITNPHKAYKFGKKVLVTFTYDAPYFHLIWGAIEWYSHKLNLPPEIYELRAKAYQPRIDAYPETVSTNFYYKMARWYWRANDKSKAIRACKKVLNY